MPTEGARCCRTKGRDLALMGGTAASWTLWAMVPKCPLCLLAYGASLAAFGAFWNRGAWVCAPVLSVALLVAQWRRWRRLK